MMNLMSRSGMSFSRIWSTFRIIVQKFSVPNQTSWKWPQAITRLRRTGPLKAINYF